MSSYYTMYEKPTFGLLYHHYDKLKEKKFKTTNILDGLQDFDPRDKSVNTNLNTASILALDQGGFAYRNMFDTFFQHYSDETRPIKTVDEMDVYGRTALHWMAGSRCLKGATRLLEKKANVNATTLLEGFTPLMIACRQGGDLPILRLLIANGADVNMRAYSGASAFHIAAASSSRDCMRLLVMHGADPNGIANDGSHAIDWTKDDKTRKVVHTCCRSATIAKDKDSATCAFCDKSSYDLKRCSMCYVTFYCDAECQVKHWKIEHRTNCPRHMIAKIFEEKQTTEEMLEKPHVVHKPVDIHSHDNKTFIVEVYPGLTFTLKSSTEIIKVKNCVKQITAKIVPQDDEDGEFTKLLDYVVNNGEGDKQSVYFWAKFKDDSKNELIVYHGRKVPRKDTQEADFRRQQRMIARSKELERAIRSNSMYMI